MPLLKRTNSYVPPDLDFTLRRQFNKPGFRPQQREIIQAALDGHDVFVQAATSFGKSLCFQLPAVVDHGSRPTLIVPFAMPNLTRHGSHHCHLAIAQSDDESSRVSAGSGHQCELAE